MTDTINILELHKSGKRNRTMTTNQTWNYYADQEIKDAPKHGETVIFVSKNARWVVTCKADNYSNHSGRIVDNHTGASDHWIEYTDGRVAFDFPERLPEYVKNFVRNRRKLDLPRDNRQKE